MRVLYTRKQEQNDKHGEVMGIGQIPMLPSINSKQR